MKSETLAYLQAHHSALLAFWTTGAPAPVDASVEQHCDMVYTLFLIGELGRVQKSAALGFAEILQTRKLPGWTGGDGAPLSVHNCAYAFGTLNLLAPLHGDLYAKALNAKKAAFEEIVDEAKALPRYPKWLAHHNWRVSHWIGGAPSILWSLGQSALPDAPAYKALADRILVGADACLDAKTGLIKLYKVEAAQKLFRLLYGARHDPDLGDVGGVAHILWVNHAAGRDYTATQALAKQASDLFHMHKPFMETVPYCLDFDVVQILRTAQQQLNTTSATDQQRASEMMRDIETFYATKLTSSYTLHKVPGALATYHECAMIAQTPAGDLGAPIDIIQHAYWL